MPRPEIEAIGTKYRRIPILAIGRDIYNDTRLILSKLEELYPRAKKDISARGPEQKAIERLLQHWAVDNGLFIRAAQLIPRNLPLMRDEKFLKDRKELTGRSYTKENMDQARPEALIEIKGGFEFLETTLLADGREWVLKTDGPSLADIEAVWALHWVKGLPGALPADLVSPKKFPKTFAWIDRFDATVKAAGRNAGKARKLTGDEAMKVIGGSEWAETEGSVDESDPAGLKKGEEIEVWPTDSGFTRKDRGKLVALNGQEIVIESQTGEGKVVRVHAPRHGFRVRSVGNSKI